MVKIIGFAGRKQSGKSTAAKHLINHGFKVVSFSRPLKNMVFVLLLDMGFSADQVHSFINEDKEEIIPGVRKSARQLLQTLGTEWGRNLINPDLWVIAAKQSLAAVDYDFVVFDDVRFESEAEMIRQLGGVIVHLVRDDDNQVDEHSSECGLAFFNTDIHIVNDSTLIQFLSDVDDVVNNFVSV